MLSPATDAMRSFISRAALLVKVSARIEEGDTPSANNWAIRYVSTRVFPDPAPAMMSDGPCVLMTASRWALFRFSR